MEFIATTKGLAALLFVLLIILFLLPLQSDKRECLEYQTTTMFTYDVVLKMPRVIPVRQCVKFKELDNDTGI